MRETKFRGKRFDNNHNNWIYGFTHVIDTCGEGYTGKAIQQQSGTARPYSVRIHAETVGQYTGLMDRNGKEIYEGDVVKGGALFATDGFAIDNTSGAVVRFKNGMFKCGKISLVSVHRKGEVIGNIHDNPELLEEEEK